jgi:hypothetical protein
MDAPIHASVANHTTIECRPSYLVRLVWMGVQVEPDLSEQVDRRLPVTTAALLAVVRTPSASVCLDLPITSRCPFVAVGVALSQVVLFVASNVLPVLGSIVLGPIPSVDRFVLVREAIKRGLGDAG